MIARQGNSRVVVRFSYKLQCRFAVSSSRANDLLRLGSLRGTDNWNCLLNNSRFFTRDLSERVSQPFFMIKIYLCNYRDIKLNGARRIKASAYSRFKNNHVDFRFGETFQRERSCDFEKRRVRVPIRDEIAYHRRAVGNCVLGNNLALYAHPFAKGDEVRRYGQAGAIALRPTDGIDHGANGALAVCARDVDDLARRVDLQLAHGSLETPPP